MDLPTCPSCGQSVLDDDAVDCPFCGASMSVKPGAAAPKPAAPKPAQKKATRKKAEPSAADDPDDPFGVAAPVMSKAVSLLPKPVKGKLHRIVCPMCETPGFQSKKAAGREVRCANKECLVPIFTAPPLEGAEAEEAPRVDTAAEEKKSGGPLLLYGGVTVVMLVIGGVAWFLNKPASTAGLDAPYVPPVTAGGSGDTVSDPGTDPTATATTDPDPQPAEPVGPSPEELRAEAIELMNTVSLIRDRNSRKPYCRRMTAEAQALTNDFAGVDTQLKQLEIVGPSLKFYGVPPLVETGWQHLAAGRTAELNETIDRIQAPLETLPEYGTVTVSTMTGYAGLLAGAGQTDKAVSALRQRRNVEELGQFVETWSRSLVAPGLSFADALSQRPVTGWSEPQWATVAFVLSCRGNGDEAISWADLAPTKRARTECISAWAEGQLLTQGVAAQTLVDQQVSGLPPADRAFVLARGQLVLASRPDADTASPLLARAIEALAEAGTPAAMPMPNLKSETRLSLPDAAPLTAAVVAVAEIAHAQQLLGQNDAAWQSVTLAQNWARSMSPSPVQTRAPLTEISRLGASQIQALLKVSLNLLSDSDAQNAYLEYRNRCNRLNEVAIARLALQEQILVAAANWGLTEKVWTEISARAADDAEPAAAEPWFDTRLPARLHAQFQAAKQDALKTAVEQAVTVGRLRKNNDVSVPTALVVAQHIAGGKFNDAAGVLEQFAAANREDRDQRFQQETALRLASDLVASDKADEAIQFALSFKKSPQLAEEMLQTIGAEATTAGKPLAAMVPARGEELTPPERISLLRGLVGALQESSD